MTAEEVKKCGPGRYWLVSNGVHEVEVRVTRRIKITEGR